jgi:hypothetical protein
LKEGLTGGPHLSAGGREEEGRWAGGCGWAGKVGWAARKKRKGSGQDGEGVWGLFFFQILLNNFSNLFFKSNPFTPFHIFYKLF